ncbi:hypothetical protein BGW38_004093 [Lunasporangiospora selenospora]|uniref:Uncharacterized protein n=1 Tax=Lunasporangiospora selenospora TaxID=979761 RepID=A0A9P6KBS2_9FUNG|nr:hypothetical protein BGW38_004093 [Lunasporangiospora selenospora]
MASFPRAKVDSSTQTDPPLPFTALLDRTLDRVEANVPLNLSSITFYIRRHHLSRIEQIESLLTENIIFKFVLFRIGLRPQHVFSFLCLVVLYGFRNLYRRSVYLTTNLCAVAYPAYCSVRTINSEPVEPPRGLGLEPTVYGPAYGRRYHSSRRSSISSSRASSRPASIRHGRRQRNRVSASTSVDDLAQSTYSYSSSQEGYESSRRSTSSWGRPDNYSTTYSEENFTTTSIGSGYESMTSEEQTKKRMRRRWARFSQVRKEKATRQWLAYWSIYGTVQVIDTWSSFLLDWIPGYNLGKLLFLWWAQRRGATLVFDYFQPLIQSKSKDGREVARRPSTQSLNSEMSRQSRGGSGGGAGVGSAASSRPTSFQMLPSALAQQQQQQQQQYLLQQPQYQQRQFEQQFYTKGGGSRRETTTFRDLTRTSSGGYRREDDYEEDDEEGDDNGDDYSQRRQLPTHHRPMDLHSELMASSPHDSGAFAESSIFESAESVWSGAPASSIIPANDDLHMGAGVGSFSTSANSRLHSNNATPTPMSVQEQYIRQQIMHQQQPSLSLHQQLQQASSLQSKAEGREPTLSLEDRADSLNSYAVASTIHWNPTTSTSTATDP